MKSLDISKLFYFSKKKSEFLFIIEIIASIWYDGNMKKNRAKRVSHDKTRRLLLSLVGILGVATILLGSAIGYKLLQKQSYEQKIEALKSEKDQQFNSGSQKDHFRKGQAEVIAYYPLQGEEVIASVREKINQDIKILTSANSSKMQVRLRNSYWVKSNQL